MHQNVNACLALRTISSAKNPHHIVTAQAATSKLCSLELSFLSFDRHQPTHWLRSCLSHKDTSDALGQMVPELESPAFRRNSLVFAHVSYFAGMSLSQLKGLKRSLIRPH